MAAKPNDDDDMFVPDENEPELAKELDKAMGYIIRALNIFDKLGVSQDLVLKLVAIRARLRWHPDVDKDGVPMFSDWLTDPAQRKIRGSSSAASASRTKVSKFTRKIKRLKTSPEAKETVVSYFDLMFDALACAVKAKRT